MARPRPPAPRPSATLAIPAWVLALGVAAAVAAVAAWLPPDTLRSANHRLRARMRTAPTVLLVVLDTVRADHTSLCGYERPTTPVLARLAGTPGAHRSCTAIAPATWAIPSVASYLTGEPVPDHGVDTVRQWAATGQELRPYVRPLPSSATTLAEAYVDLGYQTALVSENPLVNEASGLLQGYSDTMVAPRFPGARGQFVTDNLRTLTHTRLDPVRPLFLTVVLSASHEPLSPVPSGLSWVPRTGAMACFGSIAGTCRAYYDGRLGRGETETFLTDLANLYDYGVSRTDAHLGLVLDELDRWGWRSGPWRMVVAGANGVLLGEEGRYGAGAGVAEALARVPVVTAGNDPQAPAPFADDDATASALDVRRVLWPGEPKPAADATTYGNRTAPPRRGDRDVSPRTRAAATWRGADKVIWRDGSWSHVNLEADPTGTVEEPLDGAPEGAVPEVERWLDLVGRGPFTQPPTP